jgi:hypothetical protein
VKSNEMLFTFPSKDFQKGSELSLLLRVILSDFQRKIIICMFLSYAHTHMSFFAKITPSSTQVPLNLATAK